MNPSVASWAFTSGVTAITDATAVVLKAASTQFRHFPTGITISNSVTNATNIVTILDDTTPVWTGFLPALGSISATLDNIVGTGNKSMSIKCSASGSVFYSVQGYDAP
jgi:type V secretory pathway adhesin AidA